jgi:hypothetical protein
VVFCPPRGAGSGRPIKEEASHGALSCHLASEQLFATVSRCPIMENMIDLTRDYYYVNASVLITRPRSKDMIDCSGSGSSITLKITDL